jgi:hypothetical protein
VSLVKWFLEMGANPQDSRGEDGFSALDMAISHDSASARVAVVKEIISQRKKELTYPRDYMHAIAKHDRLDVLNIFIEEEIFANYLGPKSSFEDCIDTLYAMLDSMAVKAFPRILELCPKEYFTNDLIDHILCQTCQNDSQTRCLQWKISQQLLDHVRVLRKNDLSSLTSEILAVSIAECIQIDEFLMVDCILSFTGPLKWVSFHCTRMTTANLSVKALGAPKCCPS